MLGVIGVICLVLVQFLPWGGISEFGFEGNAYTWEMEFRGEGAFFGEEEFSESESWYSEEIEDGEGESAPDEDVTKIRIAIPLLLAGLLLIALGAVLGFTLRGRAAGVLLLLGGVVAAVGVVLFAVAVDSIFESDQDWGAAFYLAIAGSALGLLGGVLGLVPGAKSA